MSEREHLSVLVVDDDEEDFRLVRAMAREGVDAALDIAWEPDPEAALQAMRARRHDVVLLDYRLGGRTGLDLLRQLRDEGIEPPVVILLTGQGDTAVDRAAMDLGAADYLPKMELSAPLLGRVIRHARERAAQLSWLRQRDAMLSRMAILVESSDDAIIAKDLDGIVTSWNPGAERLYGYRETEIVGRSLSLVFPPERRHELADLLGRIRRGERIQHFETERMRKDGSRVAVSVSISPIHGPGGELIGASAIARDISERLRHDRLREMHSNVSRILSDARSLEEAAPLLLRQIGEGLGWQIGQFWTGIREAGVLLRAGSWCAAGIAPTAMQALLRHETFARGEGIPGGVWESGRVRWVRDLSALSDDEFPGPATAAANGLRAAAAFPVLDGATCVGVIEFFCDTGLAEENLAQVVESLGKQIGEFVKRTEAEAALRNSEEHLRLILDAAAEGIYGLDRQGHCTFANAAAAALLGYAAPENLIGRPMHALTHHSHADGRAYDVSECRKLRAVRHGENVFSDQEVFWRADGTSFRVEYRACPIRKEGVVVGAVVTFFDVTERHQARVAVAESEQRFRALSEASFSAIVIIEDGVIREANQGTAMFGYDPRDLVGMPAVDLVADESRGLVAQRIADGVDGTFEAMGRRKDGSSIPLEVTSKNIVVGGRRQRISALRDISGRRALEAQFRQAQKMEAVGRLAGGIAHDFNNLLSVITTFTDMVLGDLAPSDPRLEDLKEVRTAADRAAALTRQLLAFSRQQVVEPRLVVLESAVTNAERLLLRLIGEDIELHTVPSPVPSKTRIDPGQLDQVIMNLVVNARDAMPDGGRLTLETATVDLDEAYARVHIPAVPGRYAMLAVTDTGIGMDQSVRERIFEPFFSTKEPGKGTGLGLATVYGIVKQAGGFIWVYSEPGHGATFKVYLPVAEGEAAEDVAPVLRGAQLRGTETILLAEDEPMVRTAARRILERFGYRVLESPGGAEALVIARDASGPIHLLLTDVVMPEMSGRELAERFAAIRPGVKVLYMSGYTDDAVVRRGVISEGTPYLQKPFSAESLAHKVRTVLDG